MSLFLGIDGGGSKTAAVILDGHGVELGRGQGGPGNIAVCSDADLLRSLRDAVEGAAEGAGLSRTDLRFEGVCAAMAGVSVPQRRQSFELLLRAAIPAAAYRIEPDYVAAYWGAALGKSGVAVIAGTGAVAYGRNDAGETWREDGLGYLLGDRGSGFDLALRALRYTLDCLNEGRLDPVTEAMLAQIGARTRDEIVQWLYADFRPARVAALAPAIGELAEAGDVTARLHVAAAARSLRRSAFRVRRQLRLPAHTPIYTLGGLWNLGPFFRSEFAAPHFLIDTPEHLESIPVETERFHIVTPHRDPAYGAARIVQFSFSTL